MHELSIAMSIIDTCAEEARRHGADRVLAVHLRLGALSGVVVEALESAFELAREGSPLEASHLLIEQVRATVACPTCDRETECMSAWERRCNVCGAAVETLLRGNELEVVAIELPQ
ncbi:MAG TPA: hydrogenase maturation nickel metallochaperone HypA [Pirellulales bacterium]|jgi:hydrogenase nickel incorporation protein HypA/HybF|nr:hydrogenase maturation nickel metallochaperone HypA [Pirellulales bacterium]